MSSFHCHRQFIARVTFCPARAGAFTHSRTSGAVLCAISETATSTLQSDDLNVVYDANHGREKLVWTLVGDDGDESML